MICSHYKIVLLGNVATTLLDVGDAMMEEPDMNWIQNAQTQQFVRGSHSRVIGRGNRSREIRFSKALRTAENLITDFRKFMLQAGSEIEIAARCHAAITIYDGEHAAAATFILRDAQVVQVDGRLSGTGSPYRSYVLRGGQLTESAIDDFYLLDENEEGILDENDNPIIIF